MPNQEQPESDTGDHVAEPARPVQPRHGPGRRTEDKDHAEIDWLAEKALETEKAIEHVAKRTGPIKKFLVGGYAVMSFGAAALFWLGGQILSPRAVQTDMKNKVDGSIARLDSQFRERSESLTVQGRRNYSANREVIDSLQKAVEELRGEIRALGASTRMNTYLNCVQIRRSDPAAVPGVCYNASPQ